MKWVALLEKGSRISLRGEKFYPLETLFSHSGDGRIRLMTLTYFPFNTFALKRREMFALKGTYGLPYMGAEAASGLLAGCEVEERVLELQPSVGVVRQIAIEDVEAWAFSRD